MRCSGLRRLWFGIGLLGVAPVCDASDSEVDQAAAAVLVTQTEVQAPLDVPPGRHQCEAMVDIDSTGFPSSVVVEQCPEIFRKPILDAVAQWRWLPQKVAGEARPTRQAYLFVFEPVPPSNGESPEPSAELGATGLASVDGASEEAPPPSLRSGLTSKRGFDTHRLSWSGSGPVIQGQRQLGLSTPKFRS